MRIALISFPGSNCERETALAVKRASMLPEEILWNQPVETIKNIDGFIIIGGFSYEDRGRAGLIASLDPVINILKQASERGKPILGLCNGAQILVESGLVPGLADYQTGMALATNNRIQRGHVLDTGYYNDWVYIKPQKENKQSAFTRYLSMQQPIHIPVAHAEGRFIIPKPLLEKIEKNPNADILQYCDANGVIDSEFPVNPNGSTNNIAGISNANGNVLALMPHPERTTNGDPIFQAMRDYIAEDNRIEIKDYQYQPPEINIQQYQLPENSQQFITELIINDNTALSIQNALRLMGLNAEIKRQTHWEITSTQQSYNIKTLLETGELYNPNKEQPVDAKQIDTSRTVSLLVRDKNNIDGHHTRDILKQYFNLPHLENLIKGTLWHITTDDKNTENIMKTIIDKHILFNPFSHDYYYYA